MSDTEQPAQEAPGAAELSVSEPPVAKPATLGFTTIPRRVIWRSRDDNDFHSEVSCAIRTDGSSPGIEYLQGLQSGTDPRDPRFQPPSDDNQITDFHKLIAILEDLGRYGEPGNRSEVKHLDAGIWEIRYGSRRLSYWDTPADGTFDPKVPIKDSGGLPPDRLKGQWWYPEMDSVLRLGCGWHKDNQLAPPEKIAEAKEIRVEDCERDENSAQA